MTKFEIRKTINLGTRTPLGSKRRVSFIDKTNELLKKRRTLGDSSKYSVNKAVNSNHGSGNWMNLNVSDMSNPSQFLKTGKEKLRRTLSTVQTSVDSFAQKFRRSTRRRQILVDDNSPVTPITPQTRSRMMLGRTPTKLYSPFGIETPSNFRQKARQDGSVCTSWAFGYRRSFRVSPQRFSPYRSPCRLVPGRIEPTHLNTVEEHPQASQKNTRRSLRM